MRSGQERAECRLLKKINGVGYHAHEEKDTMRYLGTNNSEQIPEVTAVDKQISSLVGNFLSFSFHPGVPVTSETVLSSVHAVWLAGPSLPRQRQCFWVKHYAGKVKYTVENWVERNMDRIPESFNETLQSSAHTVRSGRPGEYFLAPRPSRNLTFVEGCIRTERETKCGGARGGWLLSAAHSCEAKSDIRNAIQDKSHPGRVPQIPLVMRPLR